MKCRKGERVKMCLTTIDRLREDMEPSSIGWKVVWGYDDNGVRRYSPLHLPDTHSAILGQGFYMYDEAGLLISEKDGRYYGRGVHVFDSINSARRIFGILRAYDDDKPAVVKVYCRGPLAEGVQYYYGLRRGYRVSVWSEAVLIKEEDPLPPARSRVSGVKPPIKVRGVECGRVSDSRQFFFFGSCPDCKYSWSKPRPDLPGILYQCFRNDCGTLFGNVRWEDVPLVFSRELPMHVCVAAHADDCTFVYSR